MSWRRNSGENTGKNTEEKQQVQPPSSLFSEEHKPGKGRFCSVMLPISCALFAWRA
jgi:hypothetical protein